MSRILSTLSVLALVLVAIVCLVPVGVKAEENAATQDNDYGTVIGIDLGTTYSCVA
jgi:heat shock protein 5